MTIDIDPEAVSSATNSNTDAFPGPDGPNGKKVIFGIQIGTSKYFPSDPLLLFFSKGVSKILSTALQHRNFWTLTCLVMSGREEKILSLLWKLGLSSAKVCLVILITRSGYQTAQKVFISIRNESLTWLAVRVSREVVGEEPGTQSHLGIFPQGGVQDLSTALFSWQ